MHTALGFAPAAARTRGVALRRMTVLVETAHVGERVGDVVCVSAESREQLATVRVQVLLDGVAARVDPDACDATEGPGLHEHDGGVSLAAVFRRIVSHGCGKPVGLTAAQHPRAVDRRWQGRRVGVEFDVRHDVASRGSSATGGLPADRPSRARAHGPMPSTPQGADVPKAPRGERVATIIHAERPDESRHGRHHRTQDLDPLTATSSGILPHVPMQCICGIDQRLGACARERSSRSFPSAAGLGE